MTTIPQILKLEKTDMQRVGESPLFSLGNGEHQGFFVKFSNLISVEKNLPMSMKFAKSIKSCSDCGGDADLVQRNRIGKGDVEM